MTGHLLGCEQLGVPWQLLVSISCAAFWIHNGCHPAAWSDQSTIISHSISWQLIQTAFEPLAIHQPFNHYDTVQPINVMNTCHSPWYSVDFAQFLPNPTIIILTIIIPTISWRFQPRILAAHGMASQGLSWALRGGAQYGFAHQTGRGSRRRCWRTGAVCLGRAVGMVGAMDEPTKIRIHGLYKLWFRSSW